MTSYETWRLIGGPLDGHTIELAHDDVMHPSTGAMKIGDDNGQLWLGEYTFRREGVRCVGRWAAA